MRRVVWFFLLVFTPMVCVAEIYVSSNFVLQDPVITIEGSLSSSSNFNYYSATGQTAIGEMVGTNFSSRSGFLYFPVVTTPIISATPGNQSVSLSWTASVGELGWNVSQYAVGESTVSGGPYTVTPVGNVLSAVRTSLTNGTPYYFVVRALDAFGDTIATSTQVSATPTTPSTPPSGGGGGGSAPSQTSVLFSGRAYPNSVVTLLKDSQIAITTIAGPDARFSVSLSGISAGSYIFGLYSADEAQNRSAIVTIPVTLTQGASTQVTGIFITPTIAVDKSQVRRGETVAIFGQSAPESQITIAVHSEQEFLVQTPSDEQGVYLYNFDTTPLEIGQHSAKSRATYQNEVSPFGLPVGFRVGEVTIPQEPGTACRKADLNCDGRVNLVDFSIAAYWYRRTLSEDFRIIESERLNGDGAITIVDFSIMAYYWSG